VSVSRNRKTREPKFLGLFEHRQQVARGRVGYVRTHVSKLVIRRLFIYNRRRVREIKYEKRVAFRRTNARISSNVFRYSTGASLEYITSATGHRNGSFVLAPLGIERTKRARYGRRHRWSRIRRTAAHPPTSRRKTSTRPINRVGHRTREPDLRRRYTYKYT